MALQQVLIAIARGDVKKDQIFDLDANFSITILEVTPLILSIRMDGIEQVWESLGPVKSAILEEISNQFQ